MIKALLIKTDGTVSDVELDQEDDGTTLAALYRSIECSYVDVIRLDNVPGGADMWVDDEGLINGAELNIPASLLLTRYFNQGDPIGITGNVVITGSEVDGDTQSLQQMSRDWILSLLK